MTHYVSRRRAVDSVDAEMIDLRWLDRASFDWETVGRQHP